MTVEVALTQNNTPWLQRDQTLPLNSEGCGLQDYTPISSSLRTRPLKNRKGGSGKLAGVEVYTEPGMHSDVRLLEI